jgi:hypothetical protein
MLAGAAAHLILERLEMLVRAALAVAARVVRRLLTELRELQIEVAGAAVVQAVFQQRTAAMAVLA